MKSRNVRRRSGRSMVLKIMGGVGCLVLLVVAIRLNGKLTESRQENEDLRDRLNSVAEEAPVDNEPSAADKAKVQAELVALKKALSTTNGEMEQLRKQSAQEREQILRESAEEHETLLTGLAGVLSQIRVSQKELETLIAHLPAGDRLRLIEQTTVLNDAAPGGNGEPRTTRVRAALPPDGKLEEKNLLVPDFEIDVEPGKASAGDGPEGEPATKEPTVEDKPEFVSYTVKPGDTLSQIGRRFDVSVAKVMKLNGIVEARKLRIGQVLKIPKD